ncbi:MAG: hypothetical protein K2G85_08830, partial [Muribaculaceae bacterium]|nr:hypothetical protein [Muribaculaceae bacterium]
EVIHSEDSTVLSFPQKFLIRKNTLKEITDWSTIWKSIGYDLDSIFNNSDGLNTNEGKPIILYKQR